MLRTRTGTRCDAPYQNPPTHSGHERLEIMDVPSSSFFWPPTDFLSNLCCRWTKTGVVPYPLRRLGNRTAFHPLNTFVPYEAPVLLISLLSLPESFCHSKFSSCCQPGSFSPPCTFPTPEKQIPEPWEPGDIIAIMEGKLGIIDAWCFGIL